MAKNRRIPDNPEETDSNYKTARESRKGTSESGQRDEDLKGRPEPKIEGKTSSSSKSMEMPYRESQWWRAAENGRKPHEVLQNLFEQIELDQASRYASYKEFEKVFGHTEESFGYNEDSSDLKQNELQATIETLWAQVFKNKVSPAVSCSEADWDEWDRAKGFGRWLEGAFDQSGVYTEVFPKAGGDFLKYGTGLIRVGWKECQQEYKDKYDKEEDSEESESGEYAEVTAWSVNPRYFFVDKIESKHGKPRQIFFKDHVDRYKLYDTYCEDEEGFFGTSEERCKAIIDVTGNDDTDLGYSDTRRCDMVTIKEVFRLPSGPNSNDGRHVIWIKNCTLVDEPFTWDRFPLVKMTFGMPGDGFYGESAVKRLAPTQKLLDKLNNKIDESQDIMGVPRIIVRNSSGLKVAHIDDIPGGILEIDDVSGIKEWNAQCASPEMYGDRDSAGQKMRQLLGVSDFEAQQALPERMREMSAPALERLVEQGSARHAMTHAQFENAVVALSELYCYQAKELMDKGYDLVVKAPSGDVASKTSIETLNFKDVYVDMARMKIKVQPMSQLPQTFSGKVDAIEKLRNAQVPISDQTALRMLEVPDVAGATDMLVSDEEIIFKNLTHMTKTKQYLPPLPFDNLDLIVQLTTRYINRYRVRNDADNEVVGILAQYIDDAILAKKGLGTSDPNAPPQMSTLGAAMGLPPSPVGAPPMPGMGPVPGQMGAPMSPMPGMVPQGPPGPMA